MCCPRQLFFFQCDPGMPKGWMPLRICSDGVAGWPKSSCRHHAPIQKRTEETGPGFRNYTPFLTMSLDLGGVISVSLSALIHLN